MWRAAGLILALPALAAGAPALPSAQGPATQPAVATTIAPGVITQELGVGDVATTWVFARRGTPDVEMITDAAPLLAPGDVVAALITPGTIVARAGTLAAWPRGSVASGGTSLHVARAATRAWWQAPGVPRTPLAPHHLRFPGEVSTPAPGLRAAALGDSLPPNRPVARTITALGAAAHDPAALRLIVKDPSTRERRALGAGKTVRIEITSTELAPGLRWALAGGAPLGDAPVHAAIAGNRRGDLVWVVADSGAIPSAPLRRALAVRGYTTVYGWSTEGVGATVGARSVRSGTGAALVLRAPGVRIEQAPLRLTPGGDGVDERGAIRVVAPRAGALTLAVERAGVRTTLREEALGAPQRTGAGLDPAKRALAPGRYRLIATLTPADGTPASTDTRDVVIDPTLARFALARTRQGARPATALLFTLKRPATVRTTVRTPTGRTITIGSPARLAAGAHRREWDGRIGTQDAPPGEYTVRIQATGTLGASILQRRLTLAAGDPKRMVQAESALPER